MMLALLLARMGEEDNTTNGRNYLGWYGKLPTDRGTAVNWPIACDRPRHDLFGDRILNRRGDKDGCCPQVGDTASLEF